MATWPVGSPGGSWQQALPMHTVGGASALSGLWILPKRAAEPPLQMQPCPAESEGGRGAVLLPGPGF